MKIAIALVKVIDIPIDSDTGELFCAHMQRMLDNDEKDWYEILSESEHFNVHVLKQ